MGESTEASGSVGKIDKESKGYVMILRANSYGGVKKEIKGAETQIYGE